MLILATCLLSPCSASPPVHQFHFVFHVFARLDMSNYACRAPLSIELADYCLFACSLFTQNLFACFTCGTATCLTFPTPSSPIFFPPWSAADESHQRSLVFQLSDRNLIPLSSWRASDHEAGKIPENSPKKAEAQRHKPKHSPDCCLPTMGQWPYLAELATGVSGWVTMIPPASLPGILLLHW